MILAIDIGNTHAKLGTLPAGSRAFTTERIPTEDLATWVPRVSPEVRVGISSVVPSATRSVVAALSAAGVSPFVVSYRARLPFAMGYRTPETLGNDRIAAAAGGLLEFGLDRVPIVVIDAGTAVTYEIIDAGGVYRGGAIAPGPTMMSAALSGGTAQLPVVNEPPAFGAIGRSTREAIQSGVFWGFVDAVAGMLERIRTEVGAEAVVVATGGWGSELAQRVDGIHHLDPDLVLRGIVTLMDLNARGSQRDEDAGV